MSTHLAKLFTQDDRAVAPIIGIILLFGIFFIGFAGYQAEYVPQQNAETEFQHYQDVQNDLIVVRNAISRAGQQNQNQFESVQLGTNYRQRILAINPPAPTGTLRTSDERTITINNETDSTDITTRFLEYRNGYNELSVERIYYENSVLYLDSEQRVFFEDQNLVQDNGDAVVITALQREFSRSAVGRITVELYPTDGGDQLPTGDLEVTLPTQLPKSYWMEQLRGEEPISSFNYNDRENNVNQVLFDVNSEDLEFNTVGINDEPNEGSKLNTGTDTSDTSDQTQASQVENVTGSTLGPGPGENGQKELQFNIENTGDTPVEITDFSISTPGNVNSAITTVTNIDKNKPKNEVEISDGFANPDGKTGNEDNNYNTDGTTYSLNTTASLTSGAVEGVTMGEFNDGNVQLIYDLIGDPSKSDLTVTLTFGDNSTEEYYFRVTNVNN